MVNIYCWFSYSKPKLQHLKDQPYHLASLVQAVLLSSNHPVLHLRHFVADPNFPSSIHFPHFHHLCQASEEGDSAV